MFSIKKWFKSSWLGKKWEKLGRGYDSSKLNTRFRGYLIDARIWNFVIWPSVSIVAGAVLALVIETLLPGEMSWLSYSSVWLIASTFVFWPDGKETVPAGHVAMLTFFGRRMRVYRTEGDYYWKGNVLFLDRSRVVKGEGTTGKLDKDTGESIGNREDAGFIRITPFQVKVWNSSAERNIITIKAPASNNASIFTTLTLTGQLYDPYLWVQFEDPLLALADRTREAFRGAIRHFTDSDCSDLKQRLGLLVEGYTLLGGFVRKNFKEGRPNSIIRSESGRVMVEMIAPKGHPERPSAAKIKKMRRTLAEQVWKRSDVHALRSALGLDSNEEEKDKDVRPDYDEARALELLQDISVEKSVDAITDDLGFTIIDGAVGDVQLSQLVQEAGDRASSEIEQRIAQTTSAATQKKAAEFIGDAAKLHGELAVAIAAGGDRVPGVKVAVIGGDNKDKLSRAAATHATLSNNDSDEESEDKTSRAAAKRASQSNNDGKGGGS